ncbi:MAG: TrkH family potassium uptake protein [Candidatus Gastranaerophilales bacterium]|nr:TrkH family potassium uptake protein [Candidatus Gastranaerophilales bacterium]
MRLNFISIAISLIIKYMSVVMLVPFFAAVYYKDNTSVIAFAITIFVTLVIGFLLNPKRIDPDLLNDFKKSEALATVAFSWILLSLISTIPYLFYGMPPINALFESVSGITTTGATIITDFSAYPKTMFLWRSYTQWLGGMGIIVLFIAILPQFAIAGRQMFSAESPGPTDGKFTPRIKSSAAVLWKMYILFTIVLILLLKFFGMPLFDAVCNSFSAIACGGFSPNPQSIIGYNNPRFIWTIAFFIFLSGTGYPLIYKIFVQRRPLALLKNDEFFTYVGIILLFSAIIALILIVDKTYNVYNAIEESIFQVISIMTTTGFATVDYTKWPFVAQMMIGILFFTGACAGSASGGLKIIRIVFVYKYIRRELFKILHPNAVIPVRVNGLPVSNEITAQMMSFVIFYFVIFAITALAATMIERNIPVGITGAIASLGNTGPGLSLIGPMGNFDFLQPATKIIFIFNMLIGRLELIPFLAFLHPDFYNIKK